MIISRNEKEILGGLYQKRIVICIGSKTQNYIECRNGFYSPCRLPLFDDYKTSHLKNANSLSKNIICLPFFSGLKNKQISYICNQFIKLKKLK